MAAYPTKRKRAIMVCETVRAQVDDTPENNLMFAVFRQSILDFVSPDRDVNREENERNRRTALSYLLSDMPHLESCGIESKWVRKLLRRYSLLPTCTKMKL